MKIAIKGHRFRGKEVIQILESLGGKNNCSLGGNAKGSYYYIDTNNRGIRCHDIDYVNRCKKYTLEEFETEFPFKVGDKVQTIPYGEPAEVIRLYPNPACIIAYKVRYKSGATMLHCPENLKFYKEMKEERNITLTLDKAQEWYKKGGELREIALQAFSETELNSLPRSWEEFCENYPVQKEECWLSGGDDIPQCSYSQHRTNKNWIPSKKSAEAHLAMIQLEQLRDCWRQGWVPDYTKTYKKYRIKKLGTEYIVDWSTGLSDFLVFQTEELAKEFLECFRDLIEKAGDLI